MGLKKDVLKDSINTNRDTLRSNLRYWNGNTDFTFGSFNLNASQFVFESAVSQDKGFYPHAIQSTGNMFKLDAKTKVKFTLVPQQS